jgi:hypothetical protein
VNIFIPSNFISATEWSESFGKKVGEGGGGGVFAVLDENGTHVHQYVA